MSDREPSSVTHPSGWWKARDGKWYRPDECPGTETEASNDMVAALSIAVGAVVVGSLLPWATTGTASAGNLTLLLGGIAGALIARWWLFSREHRGLLTASAALSAGASAVLVWDLARLTSTSHQPTSGVCLATVGALMATALAFVVRRTRPTQWGDLTT